MTAANLCLEAVYFNNLTLLSAVFIANQGPYSSTILRLSLTWILSFSQAFTNLDQNGIYQHS